MLFAYRMLDRYLSNLNEAGLFNNEALEHVNIKRSQDLLQNLKIASDKSKVLTSAFQCCPFNVEIFYKAEQLGLIGDDEIETLKTLKQFDVFFDEMKHRFVSLKHTDNINSDLDSMESLLRILCLCSGKNKEFYYKQYTKAIYQNIVSEYKTIRNYSENTEACSEILDSLGDDILTTSEDDLHGIAEKKVLKIVSTQSFEVLISRCGYSNLLQEISPKNDMGRTFASKTELDTYYITTLFNNLSALLSEKQKKTKTRIDNQTEKERAINSKRSQRKVFASIALCVLLILPIMIQFILVNAWVNDITDYVENMISVNIEKESRQEDSFFNEAGLQNNFKITGIKFYKQDYGPFYIAPEVTYYSNSNDLPSITASLGTFDLCSSIGENDVTIPFYISSSDSYTTIMANDTVIQKDGTKINIDHFDDFFEGYSKDNSKQVNPYLPSGFIVLYLIYGTILVIVFLILKKKEYGLPQKTQ